MLETKLSHPEAYKSGSFLAKDYDPRLPYEKTIGKAREIADYLTHAPVSQGMHDLVSYARGKAYDLGRMLNDAYTSLQSNYQTIKQKSIDFLHSLKPFETTKIRMYLNHGLEPALAFAGNRVDLHYFSREEMKEMAGIGYDRLQDMYGEKAGDALKSLHKKHKGFTLAEILVVIAIIGLLAALLLPALTPSKEKAKIRACANNLKQIGYGIHLYAMDWEGKMPLDSFFGTPRTTIYTAAGKVGVGLLYPDYISSPDVFFDPTANWAKKDGPSGWQNWGAGSVNSSYLYSQAGAGRSEMIDDNPDKVIIIGHFTSETDPKRWNHDNKGCNALKGDSAVKWLPSNDAMAEFPLGDPTTAFTNADTKFSQ